MSEQASLGHDFTHKLSDYFWSSENDWIQKWLIYEIWFLVMMKQMGEKKELQY